MKFSLEEIGITAEKFYNYLEKENINSETDVKNRINKKSIINDKDSIIFDKKEHFPPKYLSSTSYIIDYSRDESGIPIEIRVNKAANYTQVIIKASRLIWNYLPFFGEDDFGNIPQTKVLKPAGLEIAKQELEKLKLLKW